MTFGSGESFMVCSPSEVRSRSPGVSTRPSKSTIAQLMKIIFVSGSASTSVSFALTSAGVTMGDFGIAWRVSCNWSLYPSIPA